MSRLEYTIPAKNFVLLKEYTHAQHFLKTVYPYYPDCIVLTADKKFPVVEQSYVDAMDIWLEHKNLRIAVFGADALNRMPKPASSHVCVMDMLISHADVGRKSEYNIESQIEIRPATIAVLLDNHFSQRGPSQGQGRQSYTKPKNHWTNDLY